MWGNLNFLEPVAAHTDGDDDILPDQTFKEWHYPNHKFPRRIQDFENFHSFSYAHVLQMKKK